MALLRICCTVYYFIIIIIMMIITTYINHHHQRLYLLLNSISQFHTAIKANNEQGTHIHPVLQFIRMHYYIFMDIIIINLYSLLSLALFLFNFDIFTFYLICIVIMIKCAIYNANKMTIGSLLYKLYDVCECESVFVYVFIYAWKIEKQYKIWCFDRHIYGIAVCA